MNNIDFGKLYDLYLQEGNNRKFQSYCVKVLRPLTEVFCKKSHVDEFYWGELKSYLYAAYFYAVDTYDETKGRTLSTWLYGIAQNRMLNFLKQKNMKKQYTCELPKSVIVEDISEDNSMNELLLKKLLHDAGIDGLDYEVYIRKKGIFGYKEMSNADIIKELGIQWHTLEQICRRNKMKLTKYKKDL